MSDTYTTNYGLVKIEAGTTGWADKANGNMDTIDTQIKTISTIAGGSGTVNSGVAGSLAYYPSTDTVVDDASGLAYVPLTGALSVTHSGGAEPAISVVASGATDIAAVVKFSGTVNTDKTNSLTITPLNGGVDSGTTIMASTTDNTANCPLYLAAKGVTRLILDGTTNQVQTAGAGTAGTPNLVLNGDVNTGIFAPAADTLAVSTAGVERTRIDSSGNVGIGGTPGYKLDVVGDPNSDILNITATADGTLGIRISPVGASSNSAKIIATRNGTDTDITIKTGGADNFKVAANGYITAPGVYANTDASAANVYVDSSGNLKRSTASAGGTVASGVSGSLAYYPSTGTTVDDTLVNVFQSGAQTSLIVPSPSGGNAALALNARTTTGDSFAAFGTNTDSTPNYWVAGNKNSSNNFVICNGSDLTATPLLTIDSAGKVGVGETTPGTLLTVGANSDTTNQNIRINGKTSTGASAGTLTNTPSAGDPAGYLSVNINGTERKIPYW